MPRGVLVFVIVSLLFLCNFPVFAVEKEDRKWQDETIYFLMIDRFNNGDFSNDLDVSV